MFSRLIRKFREGSFFGFRVVTENDFEVLKNSTAKQAELSAGMIFLKNRAKDLEQEIIKLKKDYNKKIIDPFGGDPSPVDTEKRKLYVAQVAGLHKEILEPKLRQMIAGAYLMLEEASNDRDYDQAIKGTIYALREMIRWGNGMVNEQLAIQTEQNSDIKK